MKNGKIANADVPPKTRSSSFSQHPAVEDGLFISRKSIYEPAMIENQSTSSSSRICDRFSVQCANIERFIGSAIWYFGYLNAHLSDRYVAIPFASGHRSVGAHLQLVNAGKHVVHSETAIGLNWELIVAHFMLESLALR